MKDPGKSIGAISVSWGQVNGFRLLRHHLSKRANPRSLVSVVGDMGGAQAQLLPAAQMSVWARTRDLELGDVEAAIWQKKALSRAWCMRRAVHLVPSADLAVFVRGCARRAEKEVRWMWRHGVAKNPLEELLAAALDALDEPITKRELAERVSKSLGLKLVSRRGGGWGSDREIACVKIGRIACPAYYLLHLVGARGVTCSGPNRGNEATYVRADAWIPHWRDMPAEGAETELLRRYLRAFGPATPRDFQAWTSMRLTDAREIWDRVHESTVPVEIEGQRAWILREDLRVLERATIDSPAVHLLPFFDSFLMGHDERHHLVEAKHHRSVYRPQGWIAPVILVNGRATGVWRHDMKGDRLRVRVSPFGTISSGIASRIAEEVRDLGRFLGCAEAETTIA